MYTNNYKKIMGAAMNGNTGAISSNVITNIYGSSNPVIATDGEAYDYNVFVYLKNFLGLYCNSCNEDCTESISSYSAGNRSATGCFMCCGTGNTPESITDYKLDSFVELELVNGSVGFSVSKILSINTTFKNNTNSSITIKEIGLYSRPSASTSAHSKVLIYRKVLDTPVTIAPDEVYTFTITLN